jgi:hypothetical protein
VVFTEGLEARKGDCFVVSMVAEYLGKVKP